MRQGGHLFVLRQNTNGFDLTAFSLFSSYMRSRCYFGLGHKCDYNVIALRSYVLCTGHENENKIKCSYSE